MTARRRFIFKLCHHFVYMLIYMLLLPDDFGKGIMFSSCPFAAFVRSFILPDRSKKAARVEVNTSLAFLHWVGIALYR